MPARIKAGDRVVVISGKDRGKQGRVLRIDVKNERAYVEGLNIIKRHQKPSLTMTSDQEMGGVIEKEAGIHLSNIAIADPKDGKPTRVGVQVVDGRRVRVARRSQMRID
ncbi:MAG: 50S ribosomal protein L24 [Solirubrobacteraceae bacterium]